MPQLTGACLCGAISYSTDAEPMFMAVCHCKACQRESGSAFSAAVAVPDASLTVRGSPKTFTGKGASGMPVHRSFCPECGSTMMSRADVMPGAVLLHAGPMDDTSRFKPSMELFCGSAQPWLHLGGEEMQRFPGMPG